MTVFRTVELDIVRPATTSGDVTPPGYGTQPHGVLSGDQEVLESVETLRFSDAGFVDADGIPYPPYVADAFALDRGLTLTADALGGSRSVGSITLANPEGVLDSTVLTRVNDHLPVRIRTGRKVWDASRGLDVDPAMSSLKPVFAGLGKGWAINRTSVGVDLLDATYWLASTMPVSLYGGTGKLDGDSNVSGRAMPRLRGTACNITPVLIDSTNDVYQVSDGPADITTLYEGGYTGIAFSGVVDDLYAASPQAGTYTVQTGPAGTWFRLGTKPVYTITVDAVGRFRSGAAPAAVVDILRQLLLEDLVFPAAYIDATWGETSVWNWPGGWYWDGSASVTGAAAVSTLLSGLGLSLVPTRTGTLRPIVLSVPSRNAAPVAALTSDMITNLSAGTLDSSLSPPTWRWRIGWQHNFTVQDPGSTLHPLIPADRQSLVALADRAAVWWSTDVRSRWRVPNDPALITTALSRQEDAIASASRHGALWGTQRRLWVVVVPQDAAWALDLGDAVWLQAPAPGLTGGAPGVVISEQIRSADQTVTFQILV
ncbi:hypothetical protein [Gluconobacter sp. P1C6_b]|uniref:hypothetical protein n=1 Tax=Gluconobacter sp. P1C6_b TaxID=2762619 RepID=UPI001C0475DC|nr:hypothetical protein [Gluconobacter sp. P1C6_b]